MSLRHRPFRLLTTLVVATACVTLASAGAAGAGSDDDLERIRQSGDELAKAGSASFRGRSTQDGGGPGSRVTFDGAFDFGERAGEYSARLSAFGVPSDEKVRGLLVDGAIYLGIDALRDQPGFEATPVGVEWLKLDAAILGASEIAQRDPSVSIDALRGATGKVKRVGSERVRGARTTRYRVTLDVQQAVNSAPEDQRARVQASVGKLGSDTLPADVWIDGKGRLRKLQLRLAGGAASNRGSVAFEFSDLGAPFTATRPPPSTVLDFGEILGGPTQATTGPSG
jgi:hypothetical protein